jgi:hypothetical protein
MGSDAFPARPVPARNIRDLASYFANRPSDTSAAEGEDQYAQRHNDDSARFAGHALIGYGAARNDGTIDEGLQTALSDLLGDFRHFAMPRTLISIAPSNGRAAITTASCTVFSDEVRRRRVRDQR